MWPLGQFLTLWLKRPPSGPTQTELQGVEEILHSR